MKKIVKTKAQLLEKVAELSRKLSGLKKSASRQKLAAAKIENNLRFLQLLIDTIPSPIFYKDAKGIYMGCNKAFEEFLGLTKDRIVGHTVYDVAPKELADIYHIADMEVMQKKEKQVYEAKVTPAGGLPQDVVFYKAVFLEEDGEVGGLVGIMLDITERKRVETMLHKLSSMDGLTGLANRRSFDENLEKEWQRAMRQTYPITLIMSDIDFFKNYNDAYGHIRGDQCLQKVAEVFKGVGRRPGDIVARYGGEEFVIVLPMADAVNGVKIAERLRREVEALKIAHKKSEISKIVTVSMGVATLVPERGTTPIVAIAEADKALYRAKKEGRNRVVSNQA